MEESKKEQSNHIGYREILGQRNFCKLVVANLINRFGDSVDALAFTWLVYQVTRSASWSAIIFALNVLPTIVLQPFAGAIVERKNKKNLMIVMDIMRAILVTVLAVSYLTSIINPWLMSAFTLLISSVEAFCMPASTAIVPRLLEEKYYEFGLSFNSAACKVMEIAGMAISGIIIGGLGISAAILIDASTFLLSAFIKVSMKLYQEPVMKEVRDDAGSVIEPIDVKNNEIKAVVRYFKDLKDGIKYIKSRKVVMNFCLMAFLLNALLVPLNSLQSPLVIDVLKQGSGLLSAIGVAMTIGMGIATVVYPYLVRLATTRIFICINGGCLAVSIGLITMGRFQTDNTIFVYFITSVSAFLIGFFVDLVNCVVSVQFMKCVDEEYLARAAALLSAGAMSAIPLISFVVSIIVRFYHVENIMMVCSGICVIIFLLIWIRKVNFEIEGKNESNEGKGTTDFISKTD